MADKTEIRTRGTVYLGGQAAGFMPGSQFALRSDHAAELVKAGHIEDLTPKAAPAPPAVTEHPAAPEPTQAAEHPAEP